MPASTVPTTLTAIRTELNDLFFERAEAVEALLLAVLTRQHVFILGPPGTGKSQLTREFVSRFLGATYFECLLSKNRPDSAILGPYDLPLLRDTGQFRRRDGGYLTTVNFAFLDEVGKASPTLGHDLLAALNERIKHEVGSERSRVEIPLHTAFTASNELPAAESEDEAALWDRLLIRCMVDSIQNDGLFKALMERSEAVPASTTMTFPELEEATQAVKQVVLLDDVLSAVLKIRASLRKDGITVSDRRWRESMNVIRATAYLDGREVARIEDLMALRFTLWEGLDQKQKIERTILAVASPVDAEIAVLMDSVHELSALLHSKEGESDEKLFAWGAELFGKCNAIEKQAKTLAAKVKGAFGPNANVDTLLAAVEALRAEGKRVLRIEA